MKIMGVGVLGGGLNSAGQLRILGPDETENNTKRTTN
jgi:hypothetical protein